MGSKPLDLPIAFQASRIASLFWIVLPFAACSLIVGVFRVVGLPMLAQLIVVAMYGCFVGFAFEIAGFRLVLREQDFTVRCWFTSRDYKWEDVIGWTRWGEGSLLFLRLRDGRIVGTDRPGFGTEDVERLSTILVAKAGHMVTQSKGVLPWYLDYPFGGIMRSGHPLT